MYHTRTHAYTRSHTPKHPYTHAYTHAYTRAHVRTHVRAHTLTHTHVHTRTHSRATHHMLSQRLIAADILDGNVPNRFNLQVPITPNAPGYVAMPTLAQKMHCMVIMVAADAVSDDTYIAKLKVLLAIVRAKSKSIKPTH